MFPGDGPENSGLFYDEVTPAFAYLEFVNRSMHFEFIDRDGTVMYSRDVTK